MNLKLRYLLIACLALFMLVACEEATDDEDATDDITTGDWSLVGAQNITGGEVRDFGIAMTPAGTPYLIYQDWDTDEILVKTLSGNTWETVGSGNLAETTGDQPDIAIAPDGTPYVAFQDEGISDEITVMRYTNGAWEAAGERGLSPSDGSNPDLVFASDGRAVVAFNSNEGVLVYGFNGSEWGPLGVPLSGYGEPQLAIDGSDQLYVLRANDWDSDLYKYDGTRWDTVGTHNFGLPEHAAMDGCILGLDAAGTPHVVFRNDDDSMTMLVWNGSTWDAVASPFFTTSEYGPWPEDMLIDDQGHVYVALEDDSYANFMAYNGSEWSQLEFENTLEIGYIRFAKNDAGGLYAAIVDYDDLLNVYHYE